MNASDFKPDDKVLYIPGHAHGDATHPDCERGVVTSIGISSGIVFVRYFRRDGYLRETPQATSPGDLVFVGSKTVINPAAAWPFPPWP